MCQCPIFGREIKKGVAKNDIKGAWLSTAFTFLVAGYDPIISAVAATCVAYLAITPGITGDVVRVTGKASWSLLNSFRVFLSRIKIENNHKTRPQSIASLISADFVNELGTEDSVEKFVEDVESTIKEAEIMLQQANSVTLDPSEIQRLQIEARAAELDYLLEEAKIDKELRLAEKEFQEEQLKLQNEIERLERMELDHPLEDNIIDFESKDDPISQDIESYSDLVEDNQHADSALEDYGDDEEEYIDVEEWDAMIKIAEELDSEEVEHREDWNAARELAKDLAIDNVKNKKGPIDYNNSNLDEKERMELIGKAARSAVEKFENNRTKREMTDGIFQQKLTEAGITNTANKVRAEQIDEELDYSRMTVVQLKDLLRSRGLKVSGKKAELIERLTSP